MDVDQLFSVRNAFWLGNYKGAIQEAMSTSVPESLTVEKDVFVFRSQIALGNTEIVLDEIKDSPDTPIQLQAVRLLATYLRTPEDQRSPILALLQSWLDDVNTAGNPVVQLLSAVIYTAEKDYQAALRTLRNPVNLEMMALSVQIYLKMNRTELAEKMQQRMQQQDDDATLSQLAAAWVHIARGGKRYQEASYLYQDLIAKYEPTTNLLNGIAVCKMHMKEYSDAAGELAQVTNRNSDPTTLVNVIAAMELLGKRASVQEQLDTLESIAPTHPWVAEKAALSQAFDRAAAEYKAA